MIVTALSSFYRDWGRSHHLVSMCFANFHIRRVNEAVKDFTILLDNIVRVMTLIHTHAYINLIATLFVLLL